MSVGDVATLLRLKRAREQRAIAAAATARAAVHVADIARTRAAIAAETQTATRGQEEAEIYARLRAASLPATQIRALSARLTAMAALDNYLGQQHRVTVAHHVRQMELDRTARHAAAAATRDAETIAALHDRAASAARVADESASAAELEEAASLAAIASRPHRR